MFKKTRRDIIVVVILFIALLMAGVWLSGDYEPFKYEQPAHDWIMKIYYANNSNTWTIAPVILDSLFDTSNGGTCKPIEKTNFTMILQCSGVAYFTGSYETHNFLIYDIPDNPKVKKIN